MLLFIDNWSSFNLIISDSYIFLSNSNDYFLDYYKFSLISYLASENNLFAELSWFAFASVYYYFSYYCG